MSDKPERRRIQLSLSDHRLIVEALVSEWWGGDGWKKHCPDVADDLTVLVTDGGEGEPLVDVAGRLVEALNGIKCHSNNDGDCDWEGCPQRHDRKPACPLYNWAAYEDD